MRSVIDEIIHFSEEHESLLNDAATTLQLALLPEDVVTNNVLPFLELPKYTFYAWQ